MTHTDIYGERRRLLDAAQAQARDSGYGNYLERERARVDAARAASLHPARRGTAEWLRQRRDVADAIRYANSYTRLEAVLCALPLMQFRAWLRILGRQWSGCDNVWRYVPAIRSLLSNLGESHLACMMTLNEREHWASLPKTFTAYRGCYLDLNSDGICYSLDRDVALEFAGSYQRYRAKGTPVLVTARCRRSRSVVKLDRSEQEVIALHRQIVSIEPMPVAAVGAPPKVEIRI